MIKVADRFEYDSREQAVKRYHELHNKLAITGDALSRDMYEWEMLLDYLSGADERKANLELYTKLDAIRDEQERMTSKTDLLNMDRPWEEEPQPVQPNKTVQL